MTLIIDVSPLKFQTRQEAARCFDGDKMPKSRIVPQALELTAADAAQEAPCVGTRLEGIYHGFVSPVCPDNSSLRLGSANLSRD